MAKSNRRANRTGRSVGEMRHVRLYAWVLSTPAYRSLSPLARALLVELYALYNGSNNGDLFLSVRKAASRLNVGKTTVAPAFKELETRGFIRARQRGAFTWKERHATSWVLTEYTFAGHLPTKDFTLWQPGSEIDSSVRRSGQAVLTSGQIVASEPEKRANCPKLRTDFATLRLRRSKRSDTGSMPSRGGEIAESREQPTRSSVTTSAPPPPEEKPSCVVAEVFQNERTVGAV